MEASWGMPRWVALDVFPVGHILVVEDEPLIAIGLKVLLEDEGADVDTSMPTRATALRLAR